MDDFKNDLLIGGLVALVLTVSSFYVPIPNSYGDAGGRIGKDAYVAYRLSSYSGYKK